LPFLNKLNTRPRRATLRLRFTLVIVATIAGVAAMLGSYFLHQQRAQAEEVLKARALSLATNLAYNSEYAAFVGNLEMLRRYAEGILREPDVRYVWIEDAEARRLIQVGRLEQDASMVRESEPEEEDASRLRHYEAPSGGRILEVSTPILLHSADVVEEDLLPAGAASATLDRWIGTVHVGLSEDSSRRQVRALQHTALLLTAAISLVGVGAAVLFVRRIVGPLRSLLHGTQRIAAGELWHRVSVLPGDEIGELAESFNRMAEDLGKARSALEAHSSELENKVSERTRKLEEARSRLVQSEKLSAIGQLVAGVAHELNNPLTGVLGYAQLLMRRATDPDLSRSLEKIGSEAFRCKKIVQNLLTFARKQKPAKTLIDVNQALERALDLRSYQMRLDNVEIVTEFHPRLPRTMADFHQLQQAFLNIIVNAHQAMAEVKRRGRLTLRTSEENGRIVLEIADNGPGIPAGLREKVFDPFFTTKDVGVGTGLGLSICYGIVQEHGGQIEVESELGEGTRIIIELPIVTEPTAAIQNVRTPPAASAAVPSGASLLALIVEDEPTIVDLLHHMLAEEGFQIEHAVNGSAALGKILKKKYDLILTDLKMPGMGGAELYSRVRDVDPLQACRMVFMTGDTVSAETRSFLESTGSLWVEKPFDFDELRERLLKFVSGGRRHRPVPA
jgi:signal transduction histidine kinase/ActR/RegA family two-component response regulator